MRGIQQRRSADSHLRPPRRFVKKTAGQRRGGPKSCQRQQRRPPSELEKELWKRHGTSEELVIFFALSYSLLPGFSNEKCGQESHRSSRSLTPGPPSLFFSPSAMDKSCPIPEPFRAKAGTVFFPCRSFSPELRGPLHPCASDAFRGAGSSHHPRSGRVALSCHLAGFAVTLFASGFVSSRLTHRKALILSAITVGITLLALGFMRSSQGFVLSSSFLAWLQAFTFLQH